MAPAAALTQRFHHNDLLGGVVPDGVGVVEPAAVGVALLAVAQREALVGGPGKLVAVLHLDQVEVAAVSLACGLLLTGLKRPALHTVPVERAMCKCVFLFLTEVTRYHSADPVLRLKLSSCGRADYRAGGF